MKRNVERFDEHYITLRFISSDNFHVDIQQPKPNARQSRNGSNAAVRHLHWGNKQHHGLRPNSSNNQEPTERNIPFASSPDTFGFSLFAHWHLLKVVVVFVVAVASHQTKENRKWFSRRQAASSFFKFKYKRHFGGGSDAMHLSHSLSQLEARMEKETIKVSLTDDFVWDLCEYFHLVLWSINFKLLSFLLLDWMTYKSEQVIKTLRHHQMTLNFCHTQRCNYTERKRWQFVEFFGWEVNIAETTCTAWQQSHRQGLTKLAAENALEEIWHRPIYLLLFPTRLISRSRTGRRRNWRRFSKSKLKWKITCEKYLNAIL